MLICLFRTVILYALLILVIRLMGKRQLGEMGPLEFVVAILIADLASVPMQDLAIPLLSGIIPILTILAAELLLSVLCYRFPIWRRLFSGKPVILMENGTLLQKNLSKTRITPDELTELLREKEVVDLHTVQYAILETNGQISALVYPEEKPASAREAGIPVQPMGFPVTIISSGRLLRENLPVAGRTEDWVEGVLRDHRCRVRGRLSADRGARRADLSQRPGAGMKHLLIGLSLVAAVTGFCLWSASYVRGAVEETAPAAGSGPTRLPKRISSPRPGAAGSGGVGHLGPVRRLLRHGAAPRRNRRRGGGVRPAASDGAGRRPGRISPRLRRAAGDPGPRAGYGAAGFCKPFLRYQKRCRK